MFRLMVSRTSPTPIIVQCVAKMSKIVAFDSSGNAGVVPYVTVENPDD